MLSVSSLFTTLLCFAVAPMPALVAALDVMPGTIVQLGLGGLALWGAFRLLSPLVNSQVRATQRLDETLRKMSEAQAATLEVQRDLLQHARYGRDRDAALIAAMSALTERMNKIECAGPGKRV